MLSEGHVQDPACITACAVILFSSSFPYLSLSFLSRWLLALSLCRGLRALGYSQFLPQIVLCCNTYIRWLDRSWMMVPNALMAICTYLMICFTWNEHVNKSKFIYNTYLPFWLSNPGYSEIRIKHVIRVIPYKKEHPFT